MLSTYKYTLRLTDSGSSTDASDPKNISIIGMPKLPGMVGLLKTYFKLFESYNTEAFEYIIIVY